MDRPEARDVMRDKVLFGAAMEQLKLAAALIEQTDWAGIAKICDDHDAFGPVLAPAQYVATSRDPEWPFKVRLFKAAAAFDREWKDVLQRLKELDEC